MKIKIEGNTYEQLKFKGAILREALKVQEHLQGQQENGQFKAEDLDIMAEFLVLAFSNQFTTDDVFELEFYEITQYFRDVLTHIMKKTNDKMGALIKK